MNWMHHDYDGRAMTRPERFKFAMVLAVAALAMAVASTCTSCQRGVQPVPMSAPQPVTRTAVQAHQAAVTIRTRCPGAPEGLGYGYGSGVLIDKTRVLTAAHVITCQLGPNFILPAETIEVSGEGQNWFTAHVDASLIEKDVAALSVAGVEKYHSPVEVAAPPGLGDRVCAYSGLKPYYAIKCGAVQPFRHRPDANILFDSVIEPGMSGSGTYDDKGRLVGVLVELRTCTWARHQICGAASRSIHELRAELGI